jgi:SH3-like domain-containing protein
MPTKGASTGLPLPRFASLKTSPIDVRVGPGFRYPVTWVYQSRGLPIEIIREYDVWRQVRDADGSIGWVQELKLSGKRQFITTAALSDLHSTTETDSPVVAHIDAGVMGHITSCAIGSDWCAVTIGSTKGWLLRSSFYGTLPGEILP